jgi:hypothetical protein
MALLRRGTGWVEKGKKMDSVLQRIDAARKDLHNVVERLAFRSYLRTGLVPLELKMVLLQTESLEALEKYNPHWSSQPRAPTGQPNGGQWTDGGAGEGEAPSAKPPAQEEIDDPPLEPVYPELLFLPYFRIGRIILAFRRFIETGRRGADWSFGKFKSPKRWANQLEKRDWTPDEITETIAKGKSYRVENRVNPNNEARQYTNMRTGRFVVRDEVTKEILQVSGDGFNQNPPLK